MKRAVEPIWEATFASLPTEVVALILASGEWCATGALARTSRAWMRLLTAPWCVAGVMHRSGCERIGVYEALPPWLFFALPAYMVGEAPDYTWHQYVDDRGDDLVFPMDLTQECYFYTGGDVAKRLYGKQWCSDIDVWTTDEALRCHTPPLENTHDWDFVVKSASVDSPIQRCIEHFDISVVQQGFLQTLTSPTLYTTPLAVYSFRRRKLLIAIDPLRITLNYDSIMDEDSLRMYFQISALVQKHRIYHHCEKRLWDKPHMERPVLSDEQVAALAYLDECHPRNRFFENCELCMATLIERYDGTMRHEADIDRRDVQDYLASDEVAEQLKGAVRWTRRVMRYRNRFSDFEPLYVANPLIQREVALLAAQCAAETKERQVNCVTCGGTTVGYVADGIWGPCDDCSSRYNYDRELAALM